MTPNPIQPRNAISHTVKTCTLSPPLSEGVFVCYGCHNKAPPTAWLEQQKFIVSHFWRLRRPRSRRWQERFLLRPLSLAHRWPLFCCVLTWSFLCVGTHCWSVFVCPNFLFLKGQHSDWIRTHLTSLILYHHFLKNPISKYSRILIFWGLGIQHMK